MTSSTVTPDVRLRALHEEARLDAESASLAEQHYTAAKSASDASREEAGRLASEGARQYAMVRERAAQLAEQVRLARRDFEDAQESANQTAHRATLAYREARRRLVDAHAARQTVDILSALPGANLRPIQQQVSETHLQMEGSARQARADGVEADQARARAAEHQVRLRRLEAEAERLNEAFKAAASQANELYLRACQEARERAAETTAAYATWQTAAAKAAFSASRARLYRPGR